MSHKVRNPSNFPCSPLIFSPPIALPMRQHCVQEAGVQEAGTNAGTNVALAELSVLAKDAFFPRKLQAHQL